MMWFNKKGFIAARVNLAIGVICGVSVLAPAWTQGTLDTLTAYDQAFFSGFTLTAVATYPTTAFDLEQGSSTSTISITSDGVSQALSLQRLSMDPPHFSPNRIPGDGGNYDEGGRYILSYPQSVFVLLGPESCKTRIDRVEHKIEVTNIIGESSSRPPFFEVRPPSHPDAMNRLYRYVLPLGRGYSLLLDQIISEATSQTGLLEVVARGNLFSPKVGTWILDIDTTHDYLVRSATFLADGSDVPSVLTAHIESGIASGDLPLWQSGEFDLTPSYVVRVSLTGYSGTPQPALLQDVQRLVTTVSQNSTLIDFSSLDSEGKPLILQGLAVP